MRTGRSRERRRARGAFKIFITGVLLIILAARPLRPSAAETHEAPDLSREGSITISFRDGENGAPFSFGTKVGVFRAADISLSNGFQFVYDELFESVGAPPTLNSEFTDDLADRLEEVAEFKGISLELPSEELSENGTVKFEGLTPGLFLIAQTHRGTDSPKYQIKPFIVTLPIQNSDGSYVYDAEMLYTAREKGHGTVELMNPGCQMTDSTCMPAPEKKQEIEWPVAVFCLCGGIALGFIITRFRRRFL